VQNRFLLKLLKRVYKICHSPLFDFSDTH